MKMLMKERMGVKRRHRALGLRLVPLGLVCLMAANVAAFAQTFVDISNVTPVSINTDGTIVGGSNIRTADGAITTVNIPNSFIPAALSSINNAGVSVGVWGDVEATNHSFIRAADGTLTYFDDPAAGLDIQEGTVAESINSAGVIAGLYITTGYFTHGFIRFADGTITNFDAPGDVLGTNPLSINTAGSIAGNYIDRAGLSHGFIRAADGTITTFDAPGVSANGVSPGTFPLSINDQGIVVGYFTDAGRGFHGFVRSAEGVITTIDAPGAGRGLNQDYQRPVGTQARVINNNGEIAGFYLDQNGVYHGFAVAVSGAITSIDAPGAVMTFYGTGTVFTSMNDNGVIIGETPYHQPGVFERIP